MYRCEVTDTSHHKLVVSPYTSQGTKSRNFSMRLTSMEGKRGAFSPSSRYFKQNGRSVTAVGLVDIVGKLVSLLIHTQQI